jgi:hypothetical protein
VFLSPFKKQCMWYQVMRFASFLIHCIRFWHVQQQDQQLPFVNAKIKITTRNVFFSC